MEILVKWHSAKYGTSDNKHSEWWWYYLKYVSFSYKLRPLYAQHHCLCNPHYHSQPAACTLTYQHASKTYNHLIYHPRQNKKNLHNLHMEFNLSRHIQNILHYNLHLPGHFVHWEVYCYQSIILWWFCHVFFTNPVIHFDLLVSRMQSL